MKPSRSFFRLIKELFVNNVLQIVVITRNAADKALVIKSVITIYFVSCDVRENNIRVVRTFSEASLEAFTLCVVA